MAFNAVASNASRLLAWQIEWGAATSAIAAPVAPLQVNVPQAAPIATFSPGFAVAAPVATPSPGFVPPAAVVAPTLGFAPTTLTLSVPAAPAPMAAPPLPPAPPPAAPPPPPVPAAPPPIPAPAPLAPSPLTPPAYAYPGMAPAPMGPPTAMIQALSAQLQQLQAQVAALLASPAAAPPQPTKRVKAAKPPASPAKAPKPAQPKPKPKPKPEQPKSHFKDRDSWFISQYGSSKYNSREDVPGIDNANCGPTSLTMVATAFKKINPSAAQADAAIEKSRRLMGDGLNERNGTSSTGIARGARAYGLDAKLVNNVTLGKIETELAKGRLPIVNGNFIRTNGTLGGGHFFVVTKIKDGKAYLNDPAVPSGPRVVSTSLLMKSLNSHWSHTLVSVGP